MTQMSENNETNMIKESNFKRKHGYKGLDLTEQHVVKNVGSVGERV